jgi:lysozyme
MTNHALDVLKGCEGCRLTAYHDVAGVLTIGYGHTGIDVVSGQHITQETADNLLKQDVMKFEGGVKRLVKVPLNANQQDALTIFAFNVGLSNLEHSTLLKRVNEGNHEAAVAEFGRWNRAGEKVIPGLVQRRKSEGELYGTAV